MTSVKIFLNEEPVWSIHNKIAFVSMFVFLIDENGSFGAIPILRCLGGVLDPR